MSDSPGRSEGFARPAASLAFAVSLVLSMAGLAFAMRELPVDTSYAVGGDRSGADRRLRDGHRSGTHLARVLLLTEIIGCVAGLKLLH